MTDTDDAICNCTALRQAARRVSKLYDEALAPVGLGVNQYAILARLERVGPRRIQDLAALLVMDRSTLGHLLRPLESRGLVSLQPAATDRRSRVLHLTGIGRILLEQARPRWAQAQERFETQFGARSAGNLRAELERAAALDWPPTPPLP